jgi:acyl carrier protein
VKVNTAHSVQPGNSKPPVARWLVWTVLILIGGTILVGLAAAFLAAVVPDLDARKLPYLLGIVLFVVLFLCLKAAFNPIRGRADERHSWRDQFPTHSEQEVQRFLQGVVGSLGLRERHRCRLRPDDRVRDLTQEAFWGDGMDMVNLVMAVEKEYDLELPESFLESCRTLGDLFDYVTRHGIEPPMSAASRPHDLPET